MRSLRTPMVAALLGLAIAGVCALGQSGHQQREKDKDKGGDSKKVPLPPKPVTPRPPPKPVTPRPPPKTMQRWADILQKAPHKALGTPKNPHIFLGSAVPSGKTTTSTVQDLLINNSAGLKTDQEKGAVNKLLAGAPLSAADRDVLSNTLTSGQVLNPDVREFISIGLNSQDPGSDPNSTHKRELRYLRLRNGTQERLTVWLRYCTWTDRESWDWLPWDAKNQSKALTYHLAPAEVTYLKDQDVFISASMVQLWAESASKQWLEYRNQSLWLVPEVDDSNQHYYYATKRETYSYGFD